LSRTRWELGTWTPCKTWNMEICRVWGTWTQCNTRNNHTRKHLTSFIARVEDTRKCIQLTGAVTPWPVGRELYRTTECYDIL
jgi:hypothetical protein